MKYFLFNIGANANTDDWWARLRGIGIITAGYGNMEGDEGERTLKSLESNDWIIAYSNGNGGVGAGIVGPYETYCLLPSAELPSGYEDPSHRHWRGVDWKYFVEGLSEGIPYRELSLNGPPRTAKLELEDSENAQRIIALLAAKTPFNYQIYPTKSRSKKTLHRLLGRCVFRMWNEFCKTLWCIRKRIYSRSPY